MTRSRASKPVQALNKARVTLTPRAAEVVLTALRDAGGTEVTGFLLQDPIGYQQFVRARNLHGWQRGFFVSQSEYARVQRYAHRSQQDIVALVHSHISSTRLSREDVESLRAARIPWIVVRASPKGLEAVKYAVTPECNAVGKSDRRYG